MPFTKETAKAFGAKGGSKNTPAQRAARLKNLEKAYKYFEPQGERMNSHELISHMYEEGRINTAERILLANMLGYDYPNEPRRERNNQVYSRYTKDKQGYALPESGSVMQSYSKFINRFQGWLKEQFKDIEHLTEEEIESVTSEVAHSVGTTLVKDIATVNVTDMLGLMKHKIEVKFKVDVFDMGTTGIVSEKISWYVSDAMFRFNGTLHSIDDIKVEVTHNGLEHLDVKATIDITYRSNRA